MSLVLVVGMDTIIIGSIVDKHTGHFHWGFPLDEEAEWLKP